MANVQQLGPAYRHLRGLVAPDLTDGQLLRRFVTQRDPVAFTALAERHGRLVWSVCRHALGHEQDAEDAFQATFLVLARDAASVRKPEALASWLHGVAYRVAMRAKRDAARRRKHERRAALPVPEHPVSEAAWLDLQAALDEEVQRLPDRLRLPFVLYVLEGRRQAAVAAQLGWKASSVRTRLSQARQKLRSRLARRSVSLPAVLAVAFLSQESARAAVPVALRHSTVRSALGCASVLELQPASARVVTLAKGVQSAMFPTKVLTALLLTAGVLIAGVTFAPTDPRATDTPAPPSAKAPQSAPADQPPDTVEVSGRVVDPNGKPFAGASIYFFRWTRLAHEPAPRQSPQATSGPDGCFRFRIGRGDYENEEEKKRARVNALVLAVGKGLGPAVAAAGSDTTDKDGRFRIEGLIGGIKWGARVDKGPMAVNQLFHDVTLKPGETKDLGDLKAKPLR